MAIPMNEALKNVWHNLPHLASNAGQVTKNWALSSIQDVNFLKNNAMIASIFGLVALRVSLAHKAAREAVGTPDEKYRHLEALKTTTREIVGYMFGLGLVRVIEYSLNAGLTALMGREKVADHFGYSLIKNMRQQFQNLTSPSYAQSVKPEPYLKTKMDVPFAKAMVFDENRWFNKAVVQKLPGYSKLAPQKALAKFYQDIPSWSGKIVPIILSGFVLEYLSLAYPDEFNNFLARFTKDKKKTFTDDSKLSSVGEAAPISAGTMPKIAPTAQNPIAYRSPMFSSFASLNNPMTL
jgi:hypothetical protein